MKGVFYFFVGEINHSMVQGTLEVEKGNIGALTSALAVIWMKTHPVSIVSNVSTEPKPENMFTLLS